MKRKLIIFMIVLVIMMTITGCSTQNEPVKTIVIAEQFGLAYAPVQIMKSKGFLDDSLQEYNIQWVKLGNAAAIRESIIAGKLDVGFVGIPPFIIGYDHETPWKIMSGLSEAPLGLMSSNPNITTVKDIDRQAKIALPQPGSIQHILLQMAAKKEFNNPTRFDQQLVTMNHPDGMNALIADNEIQLHFTSPPYLFLEQAEPDLNLILDGQTAFNGAFTFIVGITNEQFFNNKEAYYAVKEGIKQSIAFIEHNPEETIEILSGYYDYDQATLQEYLYDREIQFTEDIKGLSQFIDFMYETDVINERYDVNELLWESDHEN